jgi:predicted SprT family Zn-dependent metalloprotease
MTVKDMLDELKRRGYDVERALKLKKFWDVPVVKSGKMRSTAGRATRWPNGKQEIRLATRLWLAPGNSWDHVHRTFIHELAHLICREIQSHGDEWKGWCAHLGGEPVRFHSYEHLSRRPTKAVAMCQPCDKVFHRRNRLPRHRMYTCPKCGTEVTKL